MAALSTSTIRTAAHLTDRGKHYLISSSFFFFIPSGVRKKEKKIDRLKPGL